ncbi:MAG: hypothetical protein L0G49_15395, partial [Luteococcus sp.]|uniref:hypothetical protein n=1 Tax=Luteococcus sp. TaxID=1969402 RepID=UPI002647BDBA
GARVAALYDAILLSSGVPGPAATASAPGMRMGGGAAAVVTGRDRQGTVVGRADATGFARGRDLAEGRRSARTVPLSAPGKAWTDPMCLVPDQLALFNKAGASVALRSLGADGSADQTVDFPVQMVDPAPVRVFAPS